MTCLGSLTPTPGDPVHPQEDIACLLHVRTLAGRVNGAGTDRHMRHASSTSSNSAAKGRPGTGAGSAADQALEALGSTKAGAHAVLVDTLNSVRKTEGVGASSRRVAVARALVQVAEPLHEVALAPSVVNAFVNQFKCFSRAQNRKSSSSSSPFSSSSAKPKGGGGGGGDSRSTNGMPKADNSMLGALAVLELQALTLSLWWVAHSPDNRRRIGDAGAVPLLTSIMARLSNELEAHLALARNPTKVPACLPTCLPADQPTWQLASYLSTCLPTFPLILHSASTMWLN